MRSTYVILALALCLIVYLLMKPMWRGELARKPIYATLQSVELQKRGSADSLIYEERDGYRMAGVLDIDRGRVWMVLDVLDSRGSIYSIPDMEEIRIECSVVDEIISHRKVNASIVKMLKSSCIPSV